MQLPDPYQLMGHDPAEAGLPDAATLRRAQRRILAQFELSGEVEIEINGLRIDRNQALRSLEQLEDPEKAEKLALPWKNPSLRKLLAEPGIETLISLYEQGEIRMDDVPMHMQDIYIQEIDSLVRRHWESRNFDGIIRLLRMARNLSHRGHSRAARSLNRFLPALTKELEERAESIRRDPMKARSMNTDYERLAGLGLIRLVNYLDGYFEEYKVPYRRALLACAHAMVTWPSCHSYLGQYVFALENLDSDAFFRFQVQKIRDQLMTSHQRSGLHPVAWIILGFVGIVLFFLVISDWGEDTRLPFGFGNNTPKYEMPKIDFEPPKIPDFNREVQAPEALAIFRLLPMEPDKAEGPVNRPVDESPTAIPDLPPRFGFGSVSHRLDIRNEHPSNDLLFMVLEDSSNGKMFSCRYLHPGSEYHVYAKSPRVRVCLYAGTEWHPNAPGFAKPAYKSEMTDLVIRPRVTKILTYEKGSGGGKVTEDEDDYFGELQSYFDQEMEDIRERSDEASKKLDRELDSILKDFDKQVEQILSDSSLNNLELDLDLDLNPEPDSSDRP